MNWRGGRCSAANYFSWGPNSKDTRTTPRLRATAGFTPCAGFSARGFSPPRHSTSAFSFPASRYLRPRAQDPTPPPPTTAALEFFKSIIENRKSKIPMSQRTENLEQFAIDVILGRRHGIRAAVLRALLYALSFIYERLVQLRLFLYRHRLLRQHTLRCLLIRIR